MGSIHSGRWNNYTPKVIVEQCVKLDIRNFTRMDQILRPRQHFTGHFFPRYLTESGSRETFVILFELSTLNMEQPWLELTYKSPGTGRQVTCPIALQIHYTWQGGLFWAFGCPVSTKTGRCNRRAAKLYLPPGGDVFGCRPCHNLTYRSSQESHMFDRFEAELTARYRDVRNRV